MSSSMETLADSSVLDCTCDVCGKRGTCSVREPCPRGWWHFYAVGTRLHRGKGFLCCSRLCKNQVIFTHFRRPL
jgi:hypothetical protein